MRNRTTSYTRDTKLQELMEKSKGHKLTPQEIYDQRISWVYGNLPEESTRTKEDVAREAERIYGPRPEGEKDD